AALLVSVAGYAVAVWSVVCLGRSFALLVSVRTVVRRGPYRYVRHPMYLGYILLFAGILIGALSPIVILLTAVCISLAVWRARDLAVRVVLKPQVLTGGRMKAGGVKFADTPDAAEAAARAILALEIRGQRPRGVLVEERAPVVHEYFAAVTWDGRRKLPVLIFSDMGGIDIAEVAERHPEHVGQVHGSTLLPFTPYTAKEAIAAVGVSG